VYVRGPCVLTSARAWRHDEQEGCVSAVGIRFRSISLYAMPHFLRSQDERLPPSHTGPAQPLALVVAAASAKRRSVPPFTSSPLLSTCTASGWRSAVGRRLAGARRRRAGKPRRRRRQRREGSERQAAARGSRVKLPVLPMPKSAAAVCQRCRCTAGFSCPSLFPQMALPRCASFSME